MRRLVYTSALTCLMAGASFHVAENGRAQVLKQVAQEDIPVTLGVPTNDSGSMQRLYPVVLEAIRKMSDDLNPDDEVFLAHFTMHFAIDLPPAAGALGLRSALGALAPRKTSGQWQTGTNLFDSLEQALLYEEKVARRDKTALLLITDGNDTTSLLTLKQTIAAVGHRQPLTHREGGHSAEIAAVIGEGADRLLRYFRTIS